MAQLPLAALCNCSHYLPNLPLTANNNLSFAIHARLPFVPLWPLVPWIAVPSSVPPPPPPPLPGPRGTGDQMMRWRQTSAEAAQSAERQRAALAQGAADTQEVRARVPDTCKDCGAGHCQHGWKMSQQKHQCRDCGTRHCHCHTTGTGRAGAETASLAAEPKRTSPQIPPQVSRVRSHTGSSPLRPTTQLQMAAGAWHAAWHNCHSYHELVLRYSRAPALCPPRSPGPRRRRCGGCPPLPLA
jgi:hypothetical protein